MKNYIYILISISLLFTACKEPNPIEPDTKVTINDKVEYEVIDLGDYGLELESINENIIKSRSELTTLILNNVFTTNTRIADKLKDIDFENSTLVFISGRSVAEFTNITLDSIYLESDGSVIVDYSVFRRIGISGQAFYPYLIVLIKNRTNANIRFNRRNITEGEVPQFDGFETIATDIQVDARRKWKTVFRSADEFNNWAAEYRAKDTEFISEVDFEKEIVISVGTGRFTSGDFGYLIRDIKQQGNRLVVNSVFSVINHAIDLNKPNNHFVKIKRTNLSIDFTPSFIINNVNPNAGFYTEGPKLVNIQTDNETKATINKVNNLAELFSVMPPSDELTTNTEIDFEFFDLLVIKAATQNVRITNYEIRNIKRDNLGITGNVILYPNITGTSQKYDAYLVIKILKTNIPISNNFEVIVK